MRTLLASLLVCLPLQDPDALVRKLGSPDFEEQGKAAKALEQVGPAALPALRKAAGGDDADLSAWAGRIIPRIEAQEKKLRALVAQLGSADDEEMEKAQAALLGAGSAAVPYLAEALKSESKNLRRRAERVLDEIRLAGPRPPEIDAPAPGWRGSRFGVRLGGKRNLVVRGGGGGDSEDGVLGALKWLSRHQGADGSWKAKDYDRHCNKLGKYAAGGPCAPAPGHADFDAGVTGLSLLAFLGAGYSHLSKDTYDGICFGDVVRKGLQQLLSQQDPEGCVGSRSAQKYTYSHAIAAAALAEAYGLTGSNLFKEPAQKAVDFLVAAQNPGKGWRYAVKCGDNDTSVTGWAVAALRSAEVAGLAFPRAAYDGARAWLDEVTDDAFNRSGYTHKGTGKVFIPGMNEQFDHHETLSAIAVLGRISIDKKLEDPRIVNACDLLLRDKPKWDGNAIDFAYWYYGSYALFQLDGPSGPKWKAWNEDMKSALLKHQNTGKDGCKNGSWEPVDRWSGEGGRVYATAINALTLQTYYRFAKVVEPK